MGYTHYWDVRPRLDKERFSKVTCDFRRMLPVLERLGIKLAGALGNGAPKLTSKEICFNGLENCGHAERDLGIAWPASGASGVVLAHTEGETALQDGDVSGQWFAGAKLRSRTCGGDCSHETFRISTRFEPEDWKKPEHGRFFDFCKTAYKPYDLAVVCCLIVAKHHLENEITVSSDGGLEEWRDGMGVCQVVLGYGTEFRLEG